MNDTISRQQTITALRALSDEDGYINAPHEVVTDVVRGLPPVRAKHEQTTHSERGKTDKLAPKMGETWIDVTCPNCGCEIHIESERKTDGDTISRQAAIDALHMNLMYRMGTDSNKKRLDEWINNLPSVEPKRGKWIDKSGGIECAWNYCSVCGEQAIDLYDFCPNCGADMRGEQIKELLETDVVTVFEVLKAAHDKIEEWPKRSEQDE